jgi:hypothetical protein
MFQRKRLRVGGGEGPNELEYAHALKHHTRYMVKAAITTYFRCIPKKKPPSVKVDVQRAMWAASREGVIQ